MVEQTEVPCESLSLDGAIERAYRHASKWGGAYGVYSLPDGTHIVRLEGVLRRVEQDGRRHIGTAYSGEVTELVWTWTGQNAAPAPKSPFDGPTSAPEPSVLVGHLDSELRVLHDLTVHLMAIQAAFRSSDYPRVRRLLSAGVTPNDPTSRVSYGPYLDNVRNRCMTGSETARIVATLERAAVAAARWDGLQEASDIVYGRATAVVPENGRRPGF